MFADIRIEKSTELTWVETLNVRADALATSARTSLAPLPSPFKNIFFPKSMVQLYVNDLPIHKWLNPSIHQAATTDSFINHIKTKFGWHANLYHEIDWEAKANIMKYMPVHLKPWLIKLGTDRLPLLGEKFTTSNTILCPMCHLYKENMSHFLTCSYYSSCTESQTSQLIQVFQKVRLDPYLRILIRRVLDRKSCTVYELLQDHPTFPVKDYKTLLISQEKIGWINFLKGYPSVQWDRHQLRYLRENDLPAKSGDEYWLPKLFLLIHHHTYSRWKQRNIKFHGTESEHTKTSLLQRIRGFYAVQQDLSSQDHQPFNTPLQEWPNKTSHEMSKWLHLHADHIKLCLKREKQRAKNCLQDLRQWMVKPKPKGANINKVVTKKASPKKQQILTRFFQGNKAPKSPNPKNQHTIKTTKNLKCTSDPPITKYVQTMLKLRRVKIDNTKVGNQDIPKSPIEQSVLTLSDSNSEPRNKFLSPISRAKLPIDRLVMKFERWKNCNLPQSPDNAHSKEIQDKLIGANKTAIRDVGMENN